MKYLLDNVPTEQQSPYGCWNKERPLNGIPVQHNNERLRVGVDEYYNDVFIPSVVVANTVWDGSPKGSPVPCLYGKHYGSTDNLCSGCEHAAK